MIRLTLWGASFRWMAKLWNFLNVTINLLRLAQVTFKTLINRANTADGSWFFVHRLTILTTAANKTSIATFKIFSCNNFYSGYLLFYRQDLPLFSNSRSSSDRINLIKIFAIIDRTNHMWMVLFGALFDFFTNLVFFKAISNLTSLNKFLVFNFLILLQGWCFVNSIVFTQVTHSFFRCDLDLSYWRILIIRGFFAAYSDRLRLEKWLCCFYNLRAVLRIIL